METLQASPAGLAKIKRAREAKRRTVDSVKWLEEASQILDPNWTKDKPFPEGISDGTWKRFLYGTKPINADAFKAYCQVLNLKWQDIHASITTLPLPGIYIPERRCRKVWGRNTLVQDILNRFRDPQHLSLLSLSGSAGYGKTEVASQIARTALQEDLFADVLWVTARQTELVVDQITSSNCLENLNWEQFLHQIAHQLRCPVEQVNQRLREQKRLIVLDNAETSKVEEILANLVKMLNPSRALLTSRLQTKPQYVELISIQGLEPQSSYQLLQDEAQFNKITPLLEADNQELHRIHQLSCGAPLALHFIVGRVLDDQALEPVLSALEQASGEVEIFYQFSLETAWERLSDTAKDILRYIGQMDAGVSGSELSGICQIEPSKLNQAQRDLKRWYLMENTRDTSGESRYDLHPWIRIAVRNQLVEKWQPSLEDLEKIAYFKFDVNVENGR